MVVPSVEAAKSVFANSQPMLHLLRFNASSLRAEPPISPAQHAHHTHIRDSNLGFRANTLRSSIAWSGIPRPSSCFPRLVQPRASVFRFVSPSSAKKPGVFSATVWRSKCRR
eukprot:2322784-Rhodomonas_salina.1